MQRRGSFSSEGSNSEYLKKVKADDEGSSGDSASKSPSLKLNTPKSPFPEESSPNGYLRFRFNEDCSFTSCVYREHQTHFHCMRKVTFEHYHERTFLFNGNIGFPRIAATPSVIAPVLYNTPV